jgi:hypothetical protein
MGARRGVLEAGKRQLEPVLEVVESPDLLVLAGKGSASASALGAGRGVTGDVGSLSLSLP